MCQIHISSDLSSLVSWVCWSISQLTSAKGRAHRGLDRTQINKIPFAFTPKEILENVIHIICMFLECGKKLEYPGKTRASTGRACKLASRRPEPAFEPPTSVPWSDTAPCRPCVTWPSCKWYKRNSHLPCILVHLLKHPSDCWGWRCWALTTVRWLCGKSAFPKRWQWK